MAVTDPDEPPQQHRRGMRRFALPVLLVAVAAVAVGGTLGVLALVGDDEASAEDRAGLCADVRTMVAFMRQQPDDPRWTVKIEEQAIAAGNAGDGDLEDALRDWSVNHLLGDFTGAGDATREVAALCEGT
jgi:hypothetical protein